MTECEYYQQLISQRLDGELTAAQEHELAEHLSRCADCRAVDAAFRALSEGFADSAEDAPADLCENVMGEIRRENIRKTNKRGSKRTWRSLLATAACFALICAAAAAFPRHFLIIFAILSLNATFGRSPRERPYSPANRLSRLPAQ